MRGKKTGQKWIINKVDERQMESGSQVQWEIAKGGKRR